MSILHLLSSKYSLLEYIWLIDFFPPPLRPPLHGASLHLHFTLSNVSILPRSTPKNLFLYLMTPTKTLDASPSLQTTPPPLHLLREVRPQERVPLRICRTYLWTWTNLVYQTHCLPQTLHLQVSQQCTIFPMFPLHPHSRSSQAELPNYGKFHELPGNTDVITTITIYLKDCADNRTLHNLILMLPYTSYTSLLHMEIILNHLQDLTDHPMAMIISYIKAIY